MRLGLVEEASSKKYNELKFKCLLKEKVVFNA